jgi:carboxypeptidase family protein
MKPMLSAVLLCALLLAGCASAPPLEPAHGWQLWQEQGCSGRVGPGWMNLQARGLSGVVVGASDSGASPLKEAVVYARPWPRGQRMNLTTDADGRFSFAGAGAGLYEVAVCLPGYNAWRGSVKVDPGATAAGLELSLTRDQ